LVFELAQQMNHAKTAHKRAAIPSDIAAKVTAAIKDKK
jgi:predicted small metal-binding protein